MLRPPLAYAFEAIGPAINAIALLGLLAFSLGFLYLVFELAGLPGRIAYGREHPRAEAVRVCGWLGVLTGVGWVVAIVWAYWHPRALGADAEQIVSDLERAVTRLEQREGCA